MAISDPDINNKLSTSGDSTGINSSCDLHPWDDSFQVDRKTEGQQRPSIPGQVYNHLLLKCFQMNSGVYSILLLDLSMCTFDQEFMEIGFIFFGG